MKYFTSSVIAIVSLGAIAGLWLVGSPGRARSERFDDRRVEDLKFIQQEILNYWQAKGSLPEKLEALDSDLRGVRIPSDPQTGTPYEFKKQADLSFSLCADFNSSNRDSNRRPDAYAPDPYSPEFPYYSPFGKDAPNWDYTAGRSCFERTIDPDFFKPPVEKSRD
ncbi:MAG: hypothetical protein UY92_C0006G0113 [Candidatus Magasanikbacteria bacterium GW2011_GWA2_56_11]|uniref:Type II secretion system protein GspG C-terminal domain-containing protein n=1 Tax=Candidatus Magasanikbacteria bacterium GW2011_GWA2_56_11 TaxID=1619044 RepID=A0A0G2AMK9_9BACT|nr:MAG: hypothetical protein UY92_C0006G0113 [Candidatus Magasanikbacteria bacterium GW2011_GWA2_56_11]